MYDLGRKKDLLAFPFFSAGIVMYQAFIFAVFAVLAFGSTAKQEQSKIISFISREHLYTEVTHGLQ